VRRGVLIARSLVEGALVEDKYSGDLNRRTFMAFMAKKKLCRLQKRRALPVSEKRPM
jgi:hypothetical protein